MKGENTASHARRALTRCLNTITTPRLHTVLWTAALAFGCSDSSPESPPLNLHLEGVLSAGEVQFQEFTLLGPQTIRFEVERVLPLLVNELLIDNVALGVGIGVANDDECVVTFSETLDTGETMLIAVQNGDHCVAAFEPSLIAEGNTIEFSLRLNRLD